MTVKQWGDDKGCEDDCVVLDMQIQPERKGRISETTQTRMPYVACDGQGCQQVFEEDVCSYERIFSLCK